MFYAVTQIFVFVLAAVLALVVWQGGLGWKFNAFYLLLITALLAAFGYHSVKQPVLWLLIGLSTAALASLAAGWLYFVHNTPSIIHAPATEQEKE